MAIQLRVDVFKVSTLNFKNAAKSFAGAGDNLIY